MQSLQCFAYKRGNCILIYKDASAAGDGGDHHPQCLCRRLLRLNRIAF